MFVWFIKKFMKNTYRKYLEELDEVNHLKLDIIQNYDKYTKKAVICLDHYDETDIKKISFYKDGDVNDNIIELEHVFTVIFKEYRPNGFPFYMIDYNTYNIFYNSKVISKRFKKEVFDFIKTMIFNNEYEQYWSSSCENIDYV